MVVAASEAESFWRAMHRHMDVDDVRQSEGGDLLWTTSGKWYESGDDYQALFAWMADVDDELWLYLCKGEAATDVTELGSYWDNPFEPRIGLHVKDNGQPAARPVWLEMKEAVDDGSGTD